MDHTDGCRLWQALITWRCPDQVRSKGCAVLEPASSSECWSVQERGTRRWHCSPHPGIRSSGTSAFRGIIIGFSSLRRILLPLFFFFFFFHIALHISKVTSSQSSLEHDPKHGRSYSTGQQMEAQPMMNYDYPKLLLVANRCKPNQKLNNKCKWAKQNSDCSLLHTRSTLMQMMCYILLKGTD